MEVVLSAIYDILLTFGMPASTDATVVDALGKVFQFFVDAFDTISGFISTFAA